MPAITRDVKLPPTDDYRPFDLGEALSEFDRRLLAGDLRHARPIPLGLAHIDQALGGGAQLDDLILLGGPSNVGKTILGLQVAAHAARTDPETLALYLCYEHTRSVMLQRLICLESISEPDAAAPSGVTRDEIAGCIRDYHEGSQESDGPLDLQYLLERLPGAARAWERLQAYQDRLWLIKGDGLFTTDDKIGQYIELARAYGRKRILVVVDYAQRVPIRPELLHAGLDESRRIDLVMRALKGYAMKYHIPIVGVAAADEEGIRRERVHFENLWGGAMVQYEPDVALILNRDTLDLGDQTRYVRVAIEKNRHGPSELEFRHQLHGAFYCLSAAGTPVLDEESYQRERLALRSGLEADTKPEPN
jgi:replicative DNA helicase